jgi:hypothetical protein
LAHGWQKSVAFPLSYLQTMTKTANDRVRLDPSLSIGARWQPDEGDCLAALVSRDQSL